MQRFVLGALLAAQGLVYLLALAWPAPATAQPIQTPVVIVRHAEPTPNAGNDPPLRQEGRARGDDLVAALFDANVTAIVTSQFRRTRETAAKLAAVRGITPVVVPFTGDIGQHVEALAAAVRNHREGTIVVVGHGNTVPPLLKTLGGPEFPALCDHIFDRFWVLAPTGGRVAWMRSYYGPRSADDEPNCP
jgi:broad specificity phosphatase PhoE